MADESMIGMELDETRFTVDGSKIRELALAALDDDPIYQDGESATAAGFAGVPAPLNYPVLLMHWRDPGEMVRKLDLDLRRVLHGEVDWEYLRPVSAGDELTARRRVADVTTREGKRGGTMTLVKIEIEFANQSGELVARQMDTIIERAG